MVGPPSDSQKSSVNTEYTFVQAGTRDRSTAYSKNCKDISSQVSNMAYLRWTKAFARTLLHFRALASDATVQMFDTNTNIHINTTFPVAMEAGKPKAQLELNQTTTWRCWISVEDHPRLRFPPMAICIIPASLVNATNPTVFITSSDLRPPIDFQSTAVLVVLESIRQQAPS